MTTIIINTRSIEARKMVEFLKTTRYSRVIEENTPNEETIKSIQDIEAGNVNSYKSAHELMENLKDSADVYLKDIK
jgi:hypothetical protein